MESASSWPQWVSVPWKLLGLFRVCCGVSVATCCLLCRFAFMRYNNRLPLLSWQSALLFSVAYGIVWSELCKKLGIVPKILRRYSCGWKDSAVLLELQPVCCAWSLTLDASRHSFKSPYTRLKEPKFSSNLCFRPEKEQRPLSQLKCLSENLKNVLLPLPWS